MDSSTLLAAPSTGRSRFSKALPAPPPGLNSTPADTIPFPQLPALPFPPRQQSAGMSTITASPLLAPSFGTKSIDSPLPTLPSAPFATNSSQLPSPSLGAIKRKPVRKPVPEMATTTITQTTQQRKRVSSISSLLSAYSRSSAESLHRSSHTSDGSKDSETSPSSDENNGKALRSQPEQAGVARQGLGASTTLPQTVSDQSRPRTPPTQHRPNFSGSNVATSSPASVKQDTPQRREVWRRRASSNRSDRSIAVADLRLAITHGSTAATTTVRSDGGFSSRGNRSVDEKALPAIMQSRGTEPAGSTMNTLPFRDYGTNHNSQSSQSIGQRDARANLSAKQNNGKPPPPPPKQNNLLTIEAEPRISDASSIPGSVLGDILSNYSFPTPPLGESAASTPKPSYSEPPVKNSEIVKLGRKPVGSPPTTHEAASDKHPLALTPGTGAQVTAVPTPSTGHHLEVKQLPRIPGVGLRPGDKSRSPAIPFDKSPRVEPLPKNNEAVVSPVVEEMDKIKHKFKAFVHKHTSSTDASSIGSKSLGSTVKLTDDVKSPSPHGSVHKDLPVVPSMTVTEPARKVLEMPPQAAPSPAKSDAPLSLPMIETSPSGDLMPVSEESQLGGLNVVVPTQQQARLPSPSSTTSLATIQTSESYTQAPSSRTSDSRSQSQDRRSAESKGNVPGNVPGPGPRPRAGTNTSIASSMGPRGRVLRPVASAQNLHGPPSAGFRSGSRPRGATNDTLPPFAPSPMYHPFRQRPQTSSGPAPRGPRPLDGRDLYQLADSLSKNILVRRFHEERTDSFPVREADAALTDKDQATLQSIRKLFPLQGAQPAPPESDIRPAPPITDRHYNCWFRHENWVTSLNQHNSVECQTCHKKEKDPRMACCGCDVRVCYDCYERLMTEKRDLRAMVNKQQSA